MVTTPLMQPLAVPPARFAVPFELDAVPVVEPVLELPRGAGGVRRPQAFVPGALGAFAELPAPLGSLAELFSPQAFAGPLGTPLAPAVPAPADPAFGDRSIFQRGSD